MTAPAIRPPLDLTTRRTVDVEAWRARVEARRDANRKRVGA